MKKKKVSAGSEEVQFVETLKATLNSKDKAKQYFAELKLEAYDEADVLPSGTRVFVHKKTNGEHPRKGQKLVVNYVGARADGKIFDSGDFSFKLGTGEVITAWDKAFKRLRVGEKAIVFAPSQTAYGKYGAGKLIPPYTTLIFDVTLKSIS